MIRSVDGNMSSKRVMGVMYLIVSLFLFVYKELKCDEITNPEIFIGVICTGGGLLGLGLFEYFGKYNKDNKRTN